MAEPLLSCRSCGGFAPSARPTCPHCETPLARPLGGRIARVLAGLAGAGGFLMTMAACYGVAPTHQQPTTPDPNGCDADGDGVCAPQDCNDADLAIYPGAEDLDGDAVDQNCDGVDGWADPAATPATP
jgi:hypothetical protein